MTRKKRTREQTTKRPAPPKEQAAKSHPPPPASFPLVGSDVLDVVGSAGVPRRDMHDVIHAPDDGITEHHLGPLEEASVSFRPDHEVGDAGADFAEDFGRSYLQSATAGEDMSEVGSADDLDPAEVGGPFLEVDDEGKPTGGDAGAGPASQIGRPPSPTLDDARHRPAREHKRRRPRASE